MRSYERKKKKKTAKTSSHGRNKWTSNKSKSSYKKKKKNLVNSNYNLLNYLQREHINENIKNLGEYLNHSDVNICEKNIKKVDKSKNIPCVTSKDINIVNGNINKEKKIKIKQKKKRRRTNKESVCIPYVKEEKDVPILYSNKEIILYKKNESDIINRANINRKNIDNDNVDKNNVDKYNMNHKEKKRNCSSNTNKNNISIENKIRNNKWINKRNIFEQKHKKIYHNMFKSEDISNQNFKNVIIQHEHSSECSNRSHEKKKKKLYYSSTLHTNFGRIKENNTLFQEYEEKQNEIINKKYYMFHSTDITNNNANLYDNQINNNYEEEEKNEKTISNDFLDNILPVEKIIQYVDDISIEALVYILNTLDITNSTSLIERLPHRYYKEYLMFTNNIKRIIELMENISNEKLGSFFITYKEEKDICKYINILSLEKLNNILNCFPIDNYKEFILLFDEYKLLEILNTLSISTCLHILLNISQKKLRYIFDNINEEKLIMLINEVPLCKFYYINECIPIQKIGTLSNNICYEKLYHLHNSLSNSKNIHHITCNLSIHIIIQLIIDLPIYKAIQILKTISLEKIAQCIMFNKNCFNIYDILYKAFHIDKIVQIIIHLDNDVNNINILLNLANYTDIIHYINYISFNKFKSFIDKLPIPFLKKIINDISLKKIIQFFMNNKNEKKVIICFYQLTIKNLNSVVQLLPVKNVLRLVIPSHMDIHSKETKKIMNRLDAKNMVHLLNDLNDNEYKYICNYIPLEKIPNLLNNSTFANYEKCYIVILYLPIRKLIDTFHTLNEEKKFGILERMPYYIKDTIICNIYDTTKKFIYLMNPIQQIFISCMLFKLNRIFGNHYKKKNINKQKNKKDDKKNTKKYITLYSIRNKFYDIIKNINIKKYHLFLNQVTCNKIIETQNIIHNIRNKKKYEHEQIVQDLFFYFNIYQYVKKKKKEKILHIKKNIPLNVQNHDKVRPKIFNNINSAITCISDPILSNDTSYKNSSLYNKSYITKKRNSNDLLNNIKSNNNNNMYIYKDGIAPNNNENHYIDLSKREKILPIKTYNIKNKASTNIYYNQNSSLNNICHEKNINKDMTKHVKKKKKKKNSYHPKSRHGLYIFLIHLIIVIKKHIQDENDRKINEKKSYDINYTTTDNNNNNNNNNNYNYNNYNNNHNNNHSNPLSNTSSTNHNDYNKFIFYHVRKIMKNIFFSVRKILQMKNRSNVIKNISIFHIMNANLLPYMINENYNNIFYDISNNIKHTEKINHNPNISDNRNHLQEYKIFNMIQDSTEFFDANNTCVVIENEHTNIMDTSKENENIFSLKDDIPIIEDTNNVIEFDNEQIINDICVQKNKNRNPLYYVSLLFNKPNSFPYLIKKNILRIEKNDKRYKNFFFFKTATICDTIKNEECESNTQGDNIKDYILTTSNIFKKNRNNILNIYNKDTKIDNDIDKEESEQINSDNINILYCNTNVESHNNNNNNKNNNKNKNNDRNNNNRKKKDIQKSKFSDLRYKWKFSHISEKYKNKIYKINNNINGEKKNVYCLKFIFVLNNVCDLDKRNNDNINLTLNFFISKKKKKRLLNIYKQKILDSSLDIQINNEKYKNKIINFSTNISDTTCYINSNIVNIKFNKEQKNKLEYLYSLINEEDPSNKNLFNKTKCDTYIKHDGNMNVDNVHYDYKRDDHINNDKYNYNYNYSYNYNYDEKVSFNQLKNNTLDHNENKNNNILSEKFISNLLNKNIILLWSCKNIGYIFLNTDNSLHINIQDISHNLYIQIDKYNYNTHKNYFFNNNNNYKKGTYIFLNRLFVKEKIHFRKLKEAFSKIIENKKQKKKGVCKSLLEENNNENFYKCKDSENKIKYKNVNNVTNKNGSVENNNSLNKYENSTNTDILNFIHINMENNYKSEQNSAEDNMNEDIIYFGDDKYEFFNDTNILEKKNINQKNNEISIIDKQVYHDIDIDKDNYLIQYDKNIKRKNSLIFMNNTNDTCSNNMFYEQSKRDDPINEYYYKHHNSIVVNYFNNVIRESNKILSEKRNNINKQIREEIININEKSIHSLDSNEKEKVHQIISNEYNNIMEHELRKIRNPYLCDMYQFLKYSYTKEEFNIILYLKKRNKKLNKIKDMSNIKMNVSKKIINNGNNIIDVQRNGKFVPHIFNDNHILKLKLVTLVDNELCDYKLYNNKIINNNNNKETLRFEENLRKINLSFHSSHIFASNPFIVSREHFLLDQKTQNNSTAQIIQDNNNNNNNNGDRKKENNIYNENEEGIINNNIFVKGINKNTSFYNEKYNIQTQNNKDYKNEMLSLSNISYNEIMIQKCIEKDEVFKNGNNLENSKNLQNEEKSPTIKEKNIPNNNNNNNNNNKNNIYDILDNNLFKGLFIKDDIKLSKRTIQDILTSSDTNNLYKNKAFSNHKEEIQSLNTEQKINKIYIPNYSSDVVRKVSNNFSCINQSTNMPNIFSNSIGNIKRIKEKNKIMQNSNSILSDVSDIFINYNDSNKEVEKNMNSSYFNKLIIPIPGDNVNINFFEKKETHLDDNYININSHEENNINTSHIIKKSHVVSNLNYKNISDNSLKNKLCFEFSKTNHHHNNNNNNNNVDDYINNSNNNIYINDTHKNINGIMYNLGFLNLHCLLENKNKHFYLITQGYIKASNYINDQMLIHTKIYNEIFHTKKYIDAKKNTSIISSSFDSVTKQNDKLYCLHKKKRMFCNICGYILKQNFLNDFFFFKIFIVTKRAIFSNHSTINIIYQSPLIKAVFHEKDNIKYKLEQTNNNQYILKIIAIKKKKIHKTFSLSKNKHFRKCLEIELINTEKKNIENEMYERKENVLDKKIYGKQVFHKKSFDNLYNTTKDSLIINNEKYKSEVKKKKYSSYENIKNYSQSLSNTSYSNHLSTSICKANKAILNFSILDDKNKK